MTGRLLFVDSVESAEVFIDDIYKGDTPVLVSDIGFSSRIIEIRFPSGSVRQNLKFIAGISETTIWAPKSAALTADYAFPEPEARTAAEGEGSLVISSNLAESVVLVNGQAVDIQNTLVLPAGLYRVTATSPLRLPIVELLVIENGFSGTLNLEFQKDPAIARGNMRLLERGITATGLALSAGGIALCLNPIAVALAQDSYDTYTTIKKIGAGVLLAGSLLSLYSLLPSGR